MHTIVMLRKRRYFNPVTGISIKTEYHELEELNSDEFDLDDEINKLMDMLNDVEDPATQEFAQARCKFLGWSIERVYEPTDYYADSQGYVWCITGGINYAQ